MFNRQLLNYNFLKALFSEFVYNMMPLVRTGGININEMVLRHVEKTKIC